MKKQGKYQVWVLVHCEFSTVGKKTFVDEAVFSVFSSLPKAEHYMQSGSVEPFSWWKVLQLTVDDENPTETVFYYNYKGKAVKKAPFRQAKRNSRED